MNNLQVLTLDGPAGSGKGTIAERVANELGWNILDSGALYRLVAIAAQKKGIESSDQNALAALAETLNALFLPMKEGGIEIYLDDDNVTETIRTEACGCIASEVAAHQGVRKALLARQRGYLQSPGLVADGRDMGTIVFPDARSKVFLTASAEERATRRFKQLNEKGLDVNLSSLILDIEARDTRDMNRKEAPLKAASDAIILDTSDLSINEVVAQVLMIVRENTG